MKENVREKKDKGAEDIIVHSSSFDIANGAKDDNINYKFHKSTRPSVRIMMMLKKILTVK